MFCACACAVVCGLESIPVAVSMRHGGWYGVFSAVPALAPDVLRRIYRKADVHVYTDSDVVLSANKSWLMLHTRGKEEYNIRLPRRAKRVVDVISGETVASGCDSFSCVLEKFQTALFLME